MSRYQEIYKPIRERVRAGERKREIFNDYSKKGEAALSARILCQVATNANRRRFRWAHISLIVAFSLYAFFDLFVLGMTLPGNALGDFAGQLVSYFAVLLMTFVLVAKWNPMGYLMAMGISCFRLYHFLGARALSEMAIVQCVLLAVTLLTGLVLQGGLFPRTTFFLWPKRDALGVPVFEDD